MKFQETGEEVKSWKNNPFSLQSFKILITEHGVLKTQIKCVNETGGKITIAGVATKATCEEEELCSTAKRDDF